MKATLTAIIFSLFSMSMFAADNGIISKSSKYSVPETVDRLEAAFKSKGVTVFARIDHSGEAEKVGLKMRPTQLLIFGNPRAGTAMMNSSPSIAIDLPLKALVWEDEKGKAWISYNSPEYLKQRHDLNENFLNFIAAVGNFVDQASE